MVDYDWIRGWNADYYNAETFIAPEIGFFAFKVEETERGKVALIANYYSPDKGIQVFREFVKYLESENFVAMYGDVDTRLPNVEKKLLIYMYHSAKIIGIIDNNIIRLRREICSTDKDSN